MDGFRAYMRSIEGTPLLTVEEERALGLRVRDTGDVEARNELVRRNLPLVVSIAKNYRRYYLRDLMTLISEGNVGLIHAAEKYDPDKAKFSTYATYWIKQAIQYFLIREENMIRIPNSAYYGKGTEFTKFLVKRLKRFDDCEIVYRNTSVGDTTYTVDLAEIQEIINKELALLPKREQIIHIMHEYGYTGPEIAEYVGTSRQRVQQLIKKFQATLLRIADENL